MQSIYKSQDVVQVNIAAESGDMGVLANHVASIEQLKPGLLEIIEESGSSKQFFCKQDHTAGGPFERGAERSRGEGGSTLYGGVPKLTRMCAVSGGFAVVQPNSHLSINAVEGYPLEDFSAEAVKSQLAEAQKVANGTGSELEIAEAKIEIEVGNNQPSHSRAYIGPVSCPYLTCDLQVLESLQAVLK